MIYLWIFNRMNIWSIVETSLTAQKGSCCLVGPALGIHTFEQLVLFVFVAQIMLMVRRAYDGKRSEHMYLSYCHNRHSNIPASRVCKRRFVSCVPLRILLEHLRLRLYAVYTLVNLRHSKHFLFKCIYVYVLSPQPSQYVFTFLWIHIFVICGRPPK